MTVDGNLLNLNLISARIVETDNSIFRDLENRSSNVVAQLWQTMSTSNIFSLIRSLIAPLIASVTKLISHVATTERVKNFLPRSYYGYGSFDQSSLISIDWFALGQNVFNILTKGQ